MSLKWKKGQRALAERLYLFTLTLICKPWIHFVLVESCWNSAFLTGLKAVKEFYLWSTMYYSSSTKVEKRVHVKLWFFTVFNFFLLFSLYKWLLMHLVSNSLAIHYLDLNCTHESFPFSKKNFSPWHWKLWTKNCHYYLNTKTLI